MREYETLFVVNPGCTEDQVTKLNSKLLETIKKHDGDVFKQQDMGVRTLAYEIEKQGKGRYICYDYAGDSKVVPTIERILKLDESIMRFMTLTINDDIDIKARKKEIKDQKDKLEAALNSEAEAKESAKANAEEKPEEKVATDKEDSNV